MKFQETARLVIGNGKSRKEVAVSNLYFFIGFGENGLFKKEVFPEGEWFRSDEPIKQKLVKRNQLGPVVLDERFKFLKGLKPMSFDDYDLMFNSKSNYRGFIVNGVAIMESSHYGNALYLYKADSPNWFEDIIKTKFENLKKKTGSFLKRITHHSGWQRKVLEAVR